MNSNSTQNVNTLFLKMFYIFIFCIFPFGVFSQTKNADKQEAIPLAQINSDTKTDPKQTPRRVDQRKGTWSFQWGYNRDSYTQSDISFHGPGYNFTLKDVVAKDKPENLIHPFI